MTEIDPGDESGRSGRLSSRTGHRVGVEDPDFRQGYEHTAVMLADCLRGARALLDGATT